ncbi:MAG: MFS transporter, partial [Pseudomonadota bacterium]
MASPVCSILNDHLGTCWTMITGCVLSTIGLLTTALLANSAFSLCVTHGVITSWGWGIGFAVTLKTLIGVHFSRFRKLAFCVSGCGCGLGTFVFPPVVELLDERFGWRGVMLLLAGANLNLLAVAALARSPREEKKEQEEDDASTKKPTPISRRQSVDEASMSVHERPLIDRSSISLRDAEEAVDKSPMPAHKNRKLRCDYCSLLLSASKDFRFVLFSVNVFLVSVTASLVNTHLPGFALSTSATSSLGATFLLSVLGIASMIGRLLCGFVALRWSVVYIYFLTTLGLGILTIPAFLFNSYEILVAFSAAFGLFYNLGYEAGGAV